MDQAHLPDWLALGVVVALIMWLVGFVGKLVEAVTYLRTAADYDLDDD